MREERNNTGEQTKKPYPWIGLFGRTAAELRGSSFHGNDADRATLVRTFDGELDNTVLQREQRVILANADVGAGMELGATLADQNVASGDQLTAVTLDAQAL